MIPILCALLAAGEARVARSFETVRVAEGVVAFIAPEPRVGLVSGNSVAIIGDDGVLVVDSGHFPSLTRRMLAEIRRITPLPVRWLVNTHWHPDHHSGNFVYREAFPGLNIVSTEYTREQMAKQAGRFDSPKSLREVTPVLEERLRTGKKRDGTPLADDDRRYLRDALADIADAIPEFELIRPAAPDLGFERRLVVHLGRREVQVLFAGRGNTGGDAVVYLPDAKLLATGDLLVAPTPYAIGSFFRDWIATLRKLEAMDAAVIVPGHGPVQRDKGYLRLVMRLLESTASQTEAAVRAGKSLDEARKSIDLKALRAEFTGDDPVRVRMFEESFTAPGVARAWREAKEGALNDEQ